MPRRIVGDTAQLPAGKTTVADERGIGCMQEYISFSFPNGKSYLCKREKETAEAVLKENESLWPAVVIFPSGLTPEIVYAQCTFKYRSYDDHNYKEASGINNFLRKGRLVEFMREYNVASVIVGPPSLADSFYALDEPRIEESLFVIGPNGSAVRYRSEPKKTSRNPAASREGPKTTLRPRTAPAVEIRSVAASSSKPGLIRAIFRSLFG
jgi:hypothetical protein